ncbi:MAG: aminotransferase class III-fold pyridoxal phosphate-dependent enzyme, partial [Bacteroidetes bacterium]|nr:aminotransferase class III-fold pyridoxal phosphate-dependent enzyme [Bacteroidota bacterium]
MSQHNINLKDLLKPYGITNYSFKKLEGYDSTNYRIDLEDGTKRVFKYYNNPKEFKLVKEENKLMFYLANILDYSISYPFANIEGKYISYYPDGSFSRLLNFVEGSFFAKIEHNESLLYNFGKRIAEINLALANYECDTIEGRKLSWDLQHSLLNWNKVSYITDANLRKTTNYYFTQFRDVVSPKFPFLRSQIIHGDLNGWNVLTAGDDISGFIDFGDLTHSPLIGDLAIALSYAMFDKENPIMDLLPLIKGYHDTLPLLEDEIELLPYLIPIRLVTSICHSAEAKSKGTDTEYILISEKPAIKLLEKWTSINPIHIKNQILEACNFPIQETENRKNKLLEKRLQNFGKSLGLSYKSPIHMDQAAFQYMYDTQGNTYLDAYNNIPLVGHSHPKVSEAIARQQRKLNTNTRYLYDSLIEYSDKLLSYFPEKLNKVFFVNSGSAASDLAIRIANTFTERKHRLVLEHSYHGHTTSAIEISACKFDGPGGKGNNQNVTKLPLPNLYNGLFNDANLYIENAKQTIEDLISQKITPSFLIAEPISGCGGQVPIASGYLKTMKDYLSSLNILLILDEVQTGFGRLGNHFWGFESQDVIPDIVVLGKPMANGHPIGAVITTTDIADAFANGMEFFSSFGGNPVSMEAAKAVLEVLEEEELQKHAHVTGKYYKENLVSLQRDFSVIGDVRGEGLFLGIEFINEDGTPNTNRANIVTEQLKKM